MVTVVGVRRLHATVCLCCSVQDNSEFDLPHWALRQYRWVRRPISQSVNQSINQSVSQSNTVI